MNATQIIRLAPDTRPILTVVVHTEEEFDWAKEHDRNATAITHLAHIHRAQQVFDEFGIRPCYVVDYPVAAQPGGFGPLRQILETGRCEVGAHLHPWVSPPHQEEVRRFNTYPGNLPAALEEAKLATLTDAITRNFGTAPKSYLAGRYGFGPNTGAILKKLGYQVDLSFAPPNDFRGDGGPDYSRIGSEPFWFDNGLLGLPGSGGYVGWLGAGGTPFYRVSQALRVVRVPGILARLKAFERIRLSPEDYSESEMRRLTRTLFDRGQRVFHFAFHSPSVEPGMTPYVRSGTDLARFLGKMRAYFHFFFSELRGQAMTPLEIRASIEAQARFAR